MAGRLTPSQFINTARTDEQAKEIASEITELKRNSRAERRKVAKNRDDELIDLYEQEILELERQRKILNERKADQAIHILCCVPPGDYYRDFKLIASALYEGVHQDDVLMWYTYGCPRCVNEVCAMCMKTFVAHHEKYQEASAQYDDEIGTGANVSWEYNLWGMIPYVYYPGTNYEYKDLPMKRQASTAGFDQCVYDMGVQLRKNVRGMITEARVARGPLKTDGWQALQEDLVSAIQMAVRDLHGWRVSKDDFKAYEAIIRSYTPVDPLVSYLDDLLDEKYILWNGVPTLWEETLHGRKEECHVLRYNPNKRLLPYLLEECLGAEADYNSPDSNNLISLIEWSSQSMMLGAVWLAKVEQEKFDTMTVLVGPGGEGKGVFLENLCGSQNKGWYTSSIDWEKSERNIMMDAAGKVFANIEEFQRFSRVSLGKFKRMATLTKIEADYKYDRKNTVMPIKFIMVGTSNDEGNGVLPNDPSGSRRINVVYCKGIDKHGEDLYNHIVNYLNENQAQLWGEAMALYRKGVKPIIPEELKSAMFRNNYAYMSVDSDVRDCLDNVENWDKTALTTAKGTFIVDVYNEYTNETVIWRAYKKWSDPDDRSPALTPEKGRELRRELQKRGWSKGQKLGGVSLTGQVRPWGWKCPRTEVPHEFAESMSMEA